jgi:hypothetical protein
MPPLQPPAVTQPGEVSWLEFLQQERMTQQDAGNMPDDELYLRWRVYQLKARYGMF